MSLQTCIAIKKQQPQFVSLHQHVLKYPSLIIASAVFIIKSLGICITNSEQFYIKVT